MTDLSSVKAFGFSLRKRRFVREFLPGHRIQFIDDARQISSGDTVAVWASAHRSEVVTVRSDIRLLRLEDGFIRSVGLGAGLVRPLSWVVDSRGIHFDPSGPSDLEHLLETTVFEPALLARASALRRRMVKARISKYNLSSGEWTGLSARRSARKRAVLVIGQVESDASVRAGAGAVNSNLALLRQARARHPDDWVVYKPHPDVVAGLRNAGADESRAADFCDEVVTGAPIDSLIRAVDTVHVMTSLTGFEALLQGKDVVCHGLPFYAGWGLTQDVLRCDRRTRRLGLDELVAAALILYPRYVDAASGQPCSAEDALDQLIAWKARDGGQLRWWQRLIRPVLRHA